MAGVLCLPSVTHLHANLHSEAVFLKSKLDGMPRDSTPIDLSVVIDISGSMSAAMGRGEEQQAGSRLDHAKLGVQFLVQEVLRPNDRIAVSAFNQDGHLVQPLTTMQEMIPEDFLDPVRALHTNGGTKLAAGMQIGRKNVYQVGNDNTQHRHRRILFLTDMGEMYAQELDAMIQQNADEGVFVSIVAMGAEFNSSLTETVTKNKGSNYFCATNEAQLRECLVDNFDFNMFPAAFEINLSVRTADMEVTGVYGTPFDTKEVEDLVQRWSPETNSYYSAGSRAAASQLLLYSASLNHPLPSELIGRTMDYVEHTKTCITEVNTMFPSRIEEDSAMKGGLILIKLARTSTCDGTPTPVEVVLEYEDALGQFISQTQEAQLPAGRDEYLVQGYEDTQRKALLLQHYVQVCREYMQMDATPASSQTSRDTLAKKKLDALPRLQSEYAAFRDAVEDQFRKDEKLKAVVTNFERFVQLFEDCIPDQYRQDMTEQIQRQQLLTT